LLYWFVAFAAIAAPVPAVSQSDVQVGSKLVGTGGVGPSEQGWSAALSADGNTAIVGGIVDNKLIGAAWVFTRSNDVWTQQGSKLVGTSVVGQAGQGISVALSADGDTALVGGPYDNSRKGAAWVFTRSGGAWTQQGSKLVGAGAVENATQGASVALSADGNTALVGGSNDNLKAGAAWVFTRSGGVWTQQSKLVGTGAVGNAAQGSSVALSADGNTAIVGGPSNDSYAGAAWVFARSDGVWKQLGSKLIGTGAVGKAGQGFSVAMSADGNTAIVGGLGDNANTGAAWVYSRSGGTWSQQGSKLVGSRAVGEAKQGHSVAMSADGNTAVVGGLGDNSYSGAAWAYSRSGAAWSQQGDKLVGVGTIGHAEQGFSAALSADGNTAVVGGIADNRVTGAAWVHNRRDGIWTQGPFLGY
jgi:antibiotic biosynthesis monooxygenase (ABM) superfamily enzyme